MADEKKAAFGVFPQMKPRRSRQDPEAAKDVPRQLLRGWAAGTLGLPGDIEGLIRMLPGLDETPRLPTSEFYLDYLPGKAQSPAGEAAAGLGTLFGGVGSTKVARGALETAKAAGKAGRAALETVGTGPSSGGLAAQRGVIKMPGGNWLSGGVERSVRQLKTPVIPNILGEGETQLSAADAALNKWVDSNLTNYIKKQMATPDDPVRKLAEQGITHMPLGIHPSEVSTSRARKQQGFPASGMGQSELARRWEDIADASIVSFDKNLQDYIPTAGDIQKAQRLMPEVQAAERRLKDFENELDKNFVNQVASRNPSVPKDYYEKAAKHLNGSDKAEMLGLSDEYGKLNEEYRALRYQLNESDWAAGQNNPWVEKLDPKTPVYDAGIGDLGFDHIIDVLREDLAAGRIRPEQLNKVSMEQAVRRTYEYDQELAKKMQEAKAAARAGLPVYKEYPEKFRWIELNRPGAFASESEAMGHSVRGYEPPKGHPDWTPESGESGSLGYGHGGWEAIKSGKAKVYSLVDEKGQPHVTVEVGRGRLDPASVREKYPEAYAEYAANRNKYFNDIGEYLAKERPDILAEAPPEITQIKGKQNQAPREEYLPFVQDFVKSGQWSDVGDLRNTGLRRFSDAFNENEIKRIRDAGIEVPTWATPDEIKTIGDTVWPGQYGTPPGGIPEGMARGGKVRFTDNPDAMRLELAGGGLAKLKKLVKGAQETPKPLERAPAKSKEEIRAIAERIAPQMTGEYVRGKGAQTIAGKTQKQFQREKGLQHDIRPTGQSMPEPETVNIESLKDKVMIGIAGDPSIGGQTVYRVGDVPLESPSPQHAGPLYGLGRDDQKFWASGKGAATRVQNLADEVAQQYGDREVLGNYIMMTPDSANYAQHFADANLQAIDLSKMTKQQIEQFNELIRRGNAKSGPRPSFPGIEDKGAAYLHFSIDPKLRIHFNELMQMPTVTERLNLPSGADVLHAITEPDLRDLERGVTGKSIGRMIPGGKLTLSEHPTYSHDIPGEFMGSSKYPMPYELTFPDTLKSVRENPEQAPQEFGSLKMVGPRQIIDQQLIDEIRQYEEMIKALTGKAEGGAVEMAGGGTMSKVAMEAIAKLKLLREEAAAKAAQQAQYAKEMEGLATRDMPTFEQWKSVQDKKTGYADGGEITADDLIIEERPL